jgi:hypothetical protein
MNELEVVMRLMVPVSAIALFAMAWPVLRSWKI